LIRVHTDAEKTQEHGRDLGLCCIYNYEKISCINIQKQYYEVIIVVAIVVEPMLPIHSSAELPEPSSLTNLYIPQLNIIA